MRPLAETGQLCWYLSLCNCYVPFTINVPFFHTRKPSMRLCLLSQPPSSPVGIAMMIAAEQTQVFLLYSWRLPALKAQMECGTNNWNSTDPLCAHPDSWNTYRVVDFATLLFSFIRIPVRRALNDLKFCISIGKLSSAANIRLSPCFQVPPLYLDPASPFLLRRLTSSGSNHERLATMYR